jgi:tRNA (cmo5U34)-methyltransferase
LGAGTEVDFRSGRFEVTSEESWNGEDSGAWGFVVRDVYQLQLESPGVIFVGENWYCTGPWRKQATRREKAFTTLATFGSLRWDMTDEHDPFNDPQAVAHYAEGPARNVPGWADMVRMTDLLLSELVPERGTVLVVGAGGGLELKRFAESHPSWTFHGVDPAPEMLKLARATLGGLTERVNLQQGYIEDVPEGPFDGASCLLTLHFVGMDDRRRMLKEVRRRLRPGAPFVAAHFSFPQQAGERETWLARYAAFLTSSGIQAAKARAAADAVGTRLSVLAPDQDEEMLRAAGFSDVQLFYAGLAFRGWVSRSPRSPGHETCLT